MEGTKRIAVIGATGGTGEALVGQALARGHDVIVIARRPEAVTAAHPRLRVVPGDVRDASTLEEPIRGCDVLVSVVGVSSLLQARKGTTVYSEGAQAMVRAARQAGVDRLVAVTSGGVEPQANDGWFYTNVLKRFFLEPIYADMRIMERVLRESGLAWTIVRPSFLQGSAEKTDYRVSPDRNFIDDKSLSRWSLAHFLVGEVERGQYANRLVAVSN